MRSLIFLIAIVLLAMSLNAGNVSITQGRSGSQDTLIHVPEEATAYTLSFPLKNVDKLTVMYKAQSSGTVAIDYIDLEMSYQRPQGDSDNSVQYSTDDSTQPWYKTKEGTYDSSYVTMHTLIPTALADTNWHAATVEVLSPFPWGRLRIKGGSGNDESTKMKFYIGTK